jgi:hypothetical protein
MLRQATQTNESLDSLVALNSNGNLEFQWRQTDSVLTTLPIGRHEPTVRIVPAKKVYRDTVCD